VDDRLVARLLALNRDFYARFAASFSTTRSAPWPGFSRLLDFIPHDSAVLDLGCGNGRMASFLAEQRQGITYLGLDSCAQVITIARDRAPESDSIRTDFRVVDVTCPDWTAAVLPQRFDVVLALAVLQHIPGRILRLDIVRRACSVLQPGGVLLLSHWQFTSNARSRSKIVPWQVAGVDESELEPGDYLLDWRRGGVGYRYCHWLDEDEMASLAAGGGLQVVTSFRADGWEGNMNLYGVLQRSNLPGLGGSV
jgi:SAM-dependent methyltransferase